MPTVHVTLSRVDDRGDTGSTQPVETSVPEARQRVATTASNQVLALTALQADRLFWSVTATGGDVDVSFGSAPDADNAPMHLVLAGQTRSWSVTALGEKIAVKDAA
jgi:hypothetical protein